MFFIVTNVFPGCGPAALTFLSVALSLQKVGYIVANKVNCSFSVCDYCFSSEPRLLTTQNPVPMNCNVIATVASTLFVPKSSGVQKFVLNSARTPTATSQR